jgi:hypothetical protein
MPRRRNLSTDELSRIIQLRSNRTSWLKIQRITDIPRQIAKREYAAWEHSQSKEELKQARIQVATDLFKEHLQQIVGLAQWLVNDIPESITPGETRDAEAVIRDMVARWISSEAEELVSLTPRQQDVERTNQRSLHQNQMLFRSLRDHTREKVDWRVLEEWKGGWDRSREVLEALRSKSEKMVSSILDNQKPGVRDKIGASGVGEDILAKMGAGVVEVILRAVNDNTLERAFDLVQSKPINDGRGLVIFAESGSVARIELPYYSLATDVAEICKWAAKNLFIEERDGQVRLYQDGIEAMKEAVQRLENVLDPLMLRPMILRTICDLCPA